MTKSEMVIAREAVAQAGLLLSNDVSDPRRIEDKWIALVDYFRTAVRGEVWQGATERGIASIRHERIRQQEKWGEQRYSWPEWIAILGEEFGEAAKAAVDLYWFHEGANIESLREELVQVAAVAVQIIEHIDEIISRPQPLAPVSVPDEYNLDTTWGDSFTVNQSYYTGMVSLMVYSFEGSCDLTPDDADALADALRAHAAAAREAGCQSPQRKTNGGVVMETNYNAQVIGMQTVERKVYKYPLEITDDHIAIAMPKGAKVLTVQVQHDTICLWAWVDPDAPLEERTFRIAGTGHAIVERGSAYIGTVQLHGGFAVFHVFEVLP